VVVRYCIKISAGIGAGCILDGVIVRRREVKPISFITSQIVSLDATF